MFSIVFIGEFPHNVFIKRPAHGCFFFVLSAPSRIWRVKISLMFTAIQNDQRRNKKWMGHESALNTIFVKQKVNCNFLA